jgi:hypothetical protein
MFALKNKKNSWVHTLTKFVEHACGWEVFWQFSASQQTRSFKVQQKEDNFIIMRFIKLVFIMF